MIPEEISSAITEDGILLVEQKILTSNSAPADGVPASDRIVTVQHNQEPVVEIEKELLDLEKRFISGNEAGEIFGDDRPAVIAEVGALRLILSKS